MCYLAISKLAELLLSLLYFCLCDLKREQVIHSLGFTTSHTITDKCKHIQS